jgi:hypothetical protein
MHVPFSRMAGDGRIFGASRFVVTAGLLIAVVIGLAAPAHAAIIFQATGVFADGSALSGTLTIDTVGGTITASNLVVGAPSAFTFINIIGQADSPAPFFYSVQVRNAAATEDFDFGLPLHSLVGYTGGAICSSSTPSCVNSNLFNLAALNGPVLSSGSLTSPNAVPEPGTIMLGGGSLIGLALIRRRKYGLADVR